MANGSVTDEHERTGDESPTDEHTRATHREELNAGSGTRRHSHSAAPPPPPPPLPSHASVSVAELQERAVQDSENNNVDENSNDNTCDSYVGDAERMTGAYGGDLGLQPVQPQPPNTTIHPPNHALTNQDQPTGRNSNELGLEYTRPQQLSTTIPSTTHGSATVQRTRNSNSNEHETPGDETRAASHTHPSLTRSSTQSELSVRPRVRRRADQTDCAFPHQRLCGGVRRDSVGCEVMRHSDTNRHRRTHSEGNTNSAVYPPLPNLNYLSKDSRELLPPINTVPTLHPLSASDECHRSLSLAVPTSESVSQEAEELLTAFTSETLRNNSLEVPRWMAGMPSNPQMVRAGRELRLLADAFACTAERRKVRDMAESVNLGCINIDDFFNLCTELFYDGITRERIVALFTFVGDVAVHQMRLKGEEVIHRLMKWSVRYLVKYVCRWVEQAGGWVAVLSCGATFLYRCGVFVFCVFGSVAAGLFIYKTLKND